MQFVKPDVSTICVGIAMSMGALLLAGGAKGKRFVLPNSKILIHQLSGGFQGPATDIEIHAREALSLRKRLDEILAKHTGQQLEKVEQDTERDYFMTAAEARWSTGSSTRSSSTGRGSARAEVLREDPNSCSAASAARASARSRS